VSLNGEMTRSQIAIVLFCSSGLNFFCLLRLGYDRIK